MVCVGGRSRSHWWKIPLNYLKELSDESCLGLGFSFSKVSERSKFGNKYKTIPYVSVLPLVNHVFVKIIVILFICQIHCHEALGRTLSCSS